MKEQEELIALSEEELELVTGGGDPNTIKINLSLLAGGTMQVDCDSNAQVSVFREIVSKCMDVPAKKLALMFQKQIMYDNKTVESYGVANDSTVFVAIEFDF
jgi:hypothetical protein